MIFPSYLPCPTTPIASAVSLAKLNVTFPTKSEPHGGRAWRVLLLGGTPADKISRHGY
jgi:hypothetical protein